jgi:hypothetical protein
VTLDELPGYLRMLAARAGEAAIPAANGMGDAFRDELKQRLTERSHVRGTRTPAPPGSVPAKESGLLAFSVRTDPRASTPVVATAVVGPHMPPRDAVNEWGGEMHARPGNRRGMTFLYGDWYHAQHVKVPAREYMVSTVDILVADGRLTAVAARAFYAAMWG